VSIGPSSARGNLLKDIEVPPPTTSSPGAQADRWGVAIKQTEAAREKLEHAHAWYNDPMHRQWLSDAVTIATLPLTLEAVTNIAEQAIDEKLLSALTGVGKEYGADRLTDRALSDRAADFVFGRADDGLQSFGRWLTSREQAAETSRKRAELERRKLDDWFEALRKAEMVEPADLPPPAETRLRPAQHRD
jgi:hypothetical protein